MTAEKTARNFQPSPHTIPLISPNGLERGHKEVSMLAKPSLSSYVGWKWRGLRSKMLPPLPLPDTLFAAIGCQRSGTHLFREIVNSNPHVALLSEPFWPSPKPVQWGDYVRGLSASKFPPRLPLDALLLLDEYLTTVRQDVDIDFDWYGGRKPQLRTLGVNVKYNQSRSVTPLVHDLRAPPILLEYFRSRKFRIVHIIRQNVVQAALSHMIAMQRDVWQNYDHTELSGRFHIPWETLRGYIEWSNTEREEFLRLADDLPLHTCSYEDLVDDLKRVNTAGEFPADTIVLAPVAKFLGVPNEFRFASSIRKVINRPYGEILENYDELVSAIRDSPYAEFADTL
ncbi:MAG: hypothetical protein ACTHM9_06235 [Gemmatimonadales bacterium]